MHFKLPHIKVSAALIVLAIAVGVIWFGDGHKTWAAAEVPITFWAWRSTAPGKNEVVDSVDQAGANTLFIWAGQLGNKNGDITPVRLLNGNLPQGIDVHLVYNCTRDLLKTLESVKPEDLAEDIARSYIADLNDHSADGAKIVGIQLDLDYPTRLLPRYAEMIHKLRVLLPAGTIISVTGLPTWMSSPAISLVLDAVDFWTPQLYGAEIPTSLDRPIPISSPRAIRRTVSEIRRFGKPYFAGLAAYGYAIAYDKNGELVSLRGDIALSSTLRNSSLELTQQEDLGGTVRRVFRANRDLVLDGLVIAKGETLVFDMISPAALREAARAVREEAGDSLLGFCVFRLPTIEDTTNLRMNEIVDALRDRPATTHIKVSVKKLSERQFKFQIENSGSTSSFVNEALTADLPIAPGSVRGVAAIDGFAAYETLCASASYPPQKCSSARANLVRLKNDSWRPGDRPSINLIANWSSNTSLSVSIKLKDENGTVEKIEKQISIEE